VEVAVWRELAPLRPGGAERWNAIGAPAPSLGELDRLRAAKGPAVARFVSLQAELARRHGPRLDPGLLRFLTSKGAEQATASAVARHRADRFARVDHVLATDTDLETLRCAAANLALSRESASGSAAGRRRGDMTGVADAVTPPFLAAAAPRVLGLFDPDRRPAGPREARADRWSPSLKDVFQTASSLAGACVKLPPSLEEAALSEPAGGMPLALSWTSLDGEMRELSAWSGALRAEAPAREAVSLRSTGEVSSYAAGRQALPASEREARPGQWLVELDPALWRADLAGTFAAEHGASPLEAQGPGGFLLAGNRVAHPMARSWRIAGVAPGDRRRVRALLRDHSVGHLTVKTRHHPESAEVLARRFRTEGPRAGLLAVTRLAGRAVALLLED